MKSKLKLVVAAVAMVVADQASAAYANGELMLTVWDKVGAKSYTRDLGINLDAVIANPSAFSLNLDLSTDANYAGFLGLPAGSASAATWSIVAARGASAPLPTQWGILATHPAGTVWSSASTVPATMMTYEGVVNNQSINFNPALVSEVRTDPQAGYAGLSSWGDDMAGGLLIAGAIGSLDLTLNHFDAQFNSIVTQMGSVSLSSNGFLTTAPVPVPAAAWLLGSALIGMAGMARRRDDEAQAA